MKLHSQILLLVIAYILTANHYLSIPLFVGVVLWMWIQVTKVQVDNAPGWQKKDIKSKYTDNIYFNTLSTVFVLSNIGFIIYYAYKYISPYVGILS